MTVLKVIRSLAILLALWPQFAMAERYSCTVDPRYSRGWFGDQYDIMVNSGNGTLTVLETRAGQQGRPVTASLTVYNDRRISGAFRAEDMRTRTGVILDVRYSATIRRSDLRFTAGASVGDQGQRETARGNCVRID